VWPIGRLGVIGGIRVNGCLKVGQGRAWNRLMRIMTGTSSPI